MSDTDISALLCSRICHDLISPVGAIGNGVELLTEIQPDAGDELQLIGQSAETASATLQFYRLAFGAATPGDPYALAQCWRIIAGMMRRERAELVWPEQSGDITRASARLICNLVLIAASALPRGGRIAVSVDLGDAVAVEIEAEGPIVTLSPEARAWLDGDAAGGAPSPKDVHFLTAHRNLAFCNAALNLHKDDQRLHLKAEIPRGC